MSTVLKIVEDYGPQARYLDEPLREVIEGLSWGIVVVY
jgi:hypothetical protein